MRNKFAIKYTNYCHNYYSENVGKFCRSMEQKLIYISGSGRSGSTLLERILHSSPDVLALGELHCLWRLPADEITCSCGASFPEDGFWREVLAVASLDAAAIQELRHLEEMTCRSGFIARHGFSLERLAANEEVRRFLDLQLRLFAGIAQVSGKRILIDSSKAGPRAWLLGTLSQVSIVHLYRDPRDVILSWRSSKFDPGLGQAMQQFSTGMAAREWWKVEQLVRLLGRQRPVFRLDYARLCAAPRETVAMLADHCGIADRLAPQWLDSSSFTQGGDYHSLNGNPDRFDRGPVHIGVRRSNLSQVRQSDRLPISFVSATLRAIYPP